MLGLWKVALKNGHGEMHYQRIYLKSLPGGGGIFFKCAQNNFKSSQYIRTNVIYIVLAISGSISQLQKGSC